MIARQVRDDGVSIIHGIPTVFRRIANRERARWTRARIVHLGGEATRLADVELCRDRCADGVRLLIALGSTETGVVAWRLAVAASICEAGRLPELEPLAD